MLILRYDRESHTLDPTGDHIAKDLGMEVPSKHLFRSKTYPKCEAIAKVENHLKDNKVQNETLSRSRAYI